MNYIMVTSNAKEIVDQLNVNADRRELLRCINLIKVSNKGKPEYIDVEEYLHPDVGSFRRSDSPS